MFWVTRCFGRGSMRFRADYTVAFRLRPFPSAYAVA